MYVGQSEENIREGEWLNCVVLLHFDNHYKVGKVLESFWKYSYINHMKKTEGNEMVVWKYTTSYFLLQCSREPEKRHLV